MFFIRTILFTMHEISKINDQEEFLFRIYLMKRLSITDESVIVIDSVFKSDADVIKNMKFDSGFYDPNIVLAGTTYEGMDPIIIAQY